MSNQARIGIAKVALIALLVGLSLAGLANPVHPAGTSSAPVAAATEIPAPETTGATPVDDDDDATGYFESEDDDDEWD